MVVVVVAMTLSVVVVVAMSVTVVVVRMQLLLDGGLFCQQPTPLVGQFSFERCDLTFDLRQRLCHAVLSDDAQRVGGCDEVVVGQTELPVGAGVASCPVELLGVDLHAQSVV